MNENTEIMNNEVLEVAEDCVQSGSGNAWKIFGGVAALAGLAYGGYKLVKKIRKKKHFTLPKDDDAQEVECVEVNE